MKNPGDTNSNGQRFVRSLPLDTRNRVGLMRATTPGLIDIVPEVVHGYPDRILPKNEKAAVELKKRTLTNLYNQRPQWLAGAHRDLDAAVAAAYGWLANISEDDALGKLLELNLKRAGSGAGDILDVTNDDADEEDC